MPPDNNGKVTLAVLGERINTLIDSNKETSQVVKEYIKNNDIRANILERAFYHTQDNTDDNNKEIDTLRKKVDVINARSVLWEGINSLAAGIVGYFVTRK